MKYVVAILLFILPTSIARLLVFGSRYRIGRGCRIGFSIVLCERIAIEGVRVGHMNIIACDTFESKGGCVSHMNVIKGRFDLRMGEGSTIHNQNKITSPGFNPHNSALTIGERVWIGVGHTFDLTSDIKIGNCTTFAGMGTQVWTHSFYFSQTSSKRCRVDKPVEVGDYCNIGSRSLICPGVRIATGVSLGAGATASKSITEAGLYVQQALRKIEKFDAEAVISRAESSEDVLDDYHIIHEWLEG